MSKNSKIIIQSILNGDNDKALKYLYKDPLRKVRKFILSNSGTLEDADDVFQDAIVALFHYVKTGKYKTEYDLDAFLFKVAKNAWIDNVRKRQKIVSNELTEFEVKDDIDVLDDIIHHEKLQTFHSLFDKLESKCKTILSMVIFDKKSMREIADTLDYSNEKVAKNQHYRCKKYFAKLVHENEEALKILRH